MVRMKQGGPNKGSRRPCAAAKKDTSELVEIGAPFSPQRPAGSAARREKSHCIVSGVGCHLHLLKHHIEACLMTCTAGVNKRRAEPKPQKAEQLEAFENADSSEGSEEEDLLSSEVPGDVHAHVCKACGRGRQSHGQITFSTA